MKYPHLVSKIAGISNKWAPDGSPAPDAENPYKFDLFFEPVYPLPTSFRRKTLPPGAGMRRGDGGRAFLCQFITTIAFLKVWDREGSLQSPLAMDKMLRFAAHHKISPIVEHFPMRRVNEAIKKIESGKAAYRVILDADFK